MFLDESKPAAYTLARMVARLTSRRQANLLMVLWTTLLSRVSSVFTPGIVSSTTKSIGDSDERPTWPGGHTEVRQVRWG